MLSAQELKARAEEGIALSDEALRTIEAHDALEAENAAQREVDLTRDLKFEEQMRAEAEEANGNLRALIVSFNNAVAAAQDIQAKHRATLRRLRNAGGSGLALVPTLKVQGVKDRTLYRDLEEFRRASISDF